MGTTAATTAVFALAAVVAVTYAEECYELGPQGSWIQLKDMDSARASLAITALSAGSPYTDWVLATGGISTIASYPPSLSSAEMWKPADEIWIPVAEMSTKRSGHSMVSLQDGRAFVAGGHNTDGENLAVYLATTETYEPDNDRWVTMAPMTTARAEFGMTVLSDGRVLVAGGKNVDGNNNAIDDVEIWDPATNTWTTKGSLNIPLRGFDLATLDDGRVLGVGGNPGVFGVSLSQAVVYNVQQDRWWTVQSMGTPRENPSMVKVNDGRVMVIGGKNSYAGYLDTAEMYYPDLDMWKARATMTTRRHYSACTATTTNGVFCAGGQRGIGNATILASTELWSSASSTPQFGPDDDDAGSDAAIVILVFFFVGVFISLAYLHYRKGGIVPFFKNLKSKVLGGSAGEAYQSVE